MHRSLLPLPLLLSIAANGSCLADIEHFYPEQLQHMLSFAKCSSAEFTAIKEQLSAAFEEESARAAELFKFIVKNQTWKKLTPGEKLVLLTSKFPELKDKVQRLKDERKALSDEELLSEGVASLNLEQKKRIGGEFLPAELVAKMEEHGRSLSKLSGLRSTLIAVELAEARKRP